MNLKPLFIAITILFLNFSLLAQSWSQVGSDIDGEYAEDFSGGEGSVSISSDGSTVAIGAPYNDGNGSNAGHVKIYKNTNGKWKQVGSDINGAAIDDYSGGSVSLSSNGNILAIGAINNDGKFPNAGHVRIYKNVSGTWTKVGTDIYGEATGDLSGWSVSLSGDGSIVAIGAVGNNGNGPAAGHTRVYQNKSGTWTQIGSDIDGEASYDGFGICVSLSDNGNILAVGAQGNDGSGPSNSGHVRVFQNLSNTWTQIGSDIDGEAADDNSGRFVSLSGDGNTIAIGAMMNDGNGSDAGHVRVYRNKSGTWSQIGSDIDGELAGDRSGTSVSLSSDGNTLAIGAYFNDGNGNGSGHVRIFKNTNGKWAQLGADIDGETAGDVSGGSVSLSSDGTIVAIGASGNDDNGNSSGHVRIYGISGVTYSTETITSCGPYKWTNGITYTTNNNNSKDTFKNIAGSDSIVTLDLTILNPTPLGLSDTILSFSGDSVLLNISAGFSSYAWTNGDTSQKTTITNSGKYGVLASDSSRCGEDSTVVLFVNRIIQKDTNLCEGSTINLSISNTINTLNTHLMVSKNFPALSWGPMDILTNARSSDGDSNTLKIVDSLGNYNNGNYAANFCLNLEENGYNDWYLPTGYEVSNLLCPNKELINNWSSPGYYWSSTEESIRDATKLYSNTIPSSSCGSVAAPFKTDQSIVRCVRKIADIKYHWSTNESGSLIRVSPTSNTTYFCSQKIGSYSIKDSVTITLLNKSFSNESFIACDSVISSTGKIYTTSGTYYDTLTNAIGCDSIIASIVIIGDITLPTVKTKNDTIYLDQMGRTSITAIDVNKESSDNCGPISMTLSDSTFDCSQVGTSKIWLIATDRYGNVDSASAMITVQDLIKPTVVTQAVTLSLNANGYGSITVADVDNNSYDNCSIASRSLSKSTFDCSDLGVNTVYLIITDVNGNIDSTSAVVTVQDVIKPTVVTTPSDIALGYCDASYTYAIPTGDDNCSINVTQTAGLPPGSTFPVGKTVNTFEIIDPSGNTVTTSFTVDIRDRYMPFTITDTSLCNNISKLDLTKGYDNIFFIGIGVEANSKFFNPNSLESGSYSVTAEYTDSMGCLTRDTFDISIRETPMIPLIERVASDQIITAVEYNNYQWYRNGEELIGDNQQLLRVHELGIYSVLVGNTADCFETSEGYAFGIPINGENITNQGLVKVFPNPTKEFIFIQINDNEDSHLIKILDPIGNQLISHETNTKVVKLDLTSLATGTYYLNVIGILINETIVILRE